MYNIAYKFIIYPTNKQKFLINKTFDGVRFVWNQWVENFNKSKDDETKVFKTTKQLKQKFVWIKEVSATALRQKENDFKKFKKEFFNKNRKSKIGKPKFKLKKNKQAYRLQYPSVKNNTLKLDKIGWVKIILHRQIPKDAKFVNVTISKDKCNNYFASILVEQNIQEKTKTGKEVGIDVGLKSFAVLSDGTYVDNPRYLNENQGKIKKLNQHLSRKEKDSNRYEKCRNKLAKAYRKTRRQRSYFLHNVSSFIINQYDIIAIENLDVQGMMKNHKLAKSISDASWAQFFRQLEYKCLWYGKELRKVNRFEPTSKTCNICGYIKEDMTLDVRQWVCPTCHTEHDRDLNARKNILNKAKPAGVKAGLHTRRGSRILDETQRIKVRNS